jgi:hypothetical protein
LEAKVDIGDDVTTGYDFEKKVLGVSSLEISPKVIYLFRRRTNFSKAVKIVKDIQPTLNWDPKNPSTEIASIIFKTIASSLSRHSAGLFFYSALGTKLDYKYGTDCFFSLIMGNRESIVTVDLTMNRNKISKADVIISADDVKNDNFYEIAKLISKGLLSKMHSKMNHNRYIKTESYGNKYNFKANP